MVRSTTRVVRRVLVTAVGAVVLGTGFVLLAAPGPGFLVIALGLLILGTEYEWARRHAEAARRKAADLADKAAANRVSASFTVLFALGAMGAGIVWGLVETLPGSSWWTGGSLVVSGLVILATIVASLWQARTGPVPGPGELLGEDEPAAR